MSDARSHPHGYGRSEAGSRGSRSGGDGDIQASVSRLERAVDELVTTAREQFSDRATSLLDETSRRLERELDRREARGTGKAHADGDDDEPEPPRHHDRRERLDTVPRALYRDPAREKIGGVCAGIARYYGMEPWVVRCIAVTGLLFFPTIVFPAYWIAYFVMDKPPGSAGKTSRRDARRSRRRCGVKGARGRHGRDDHRSPAPELGPRFSPRYSLRNVQADLTEVELRLRRMETHVTSGQYELQRELNKIDGGDDGRT